MKSRTTVVVCGCLQALAYMGLLAGTSQAQSVRLFEPLAKTLTLEESIDLLGGTGFGTRAVARVGIPVFPMSDGPSGVRSPGPSTAYAAGIGLAATWDSALAREVGRQIGRDAKARGSRYQLGPGVNIYRAPMNGRNFEYFGEDPWLVSRIAVAYILGVQEQGVSATVKHYAGNNSEFARHTSDSLIDERALREIYLPAFEAAVKEAHVGAVMTSYNLTNGQHMSANAYLARHVLKEQWLFDGVLMSDWGGTYDGLAAARAGQDLEMPTGRFMNRDTILPAVQTGVLSASDITDKVRRQLRLADRFGWGSLPASDLSISRLNPQGDVAAYRGALEGAVLLKNQSHVLPLDLKRIKTIAVIGPAAHPSPSTAGGSGHVPSFSDVSLLQGLSRKLGPSVNVTYASGIVPTAIANVLTPFSTTAVGDQLGVQVEVFSQGGQPTEPVARRVQAHFASSTVAGLTGALSIFDWLSPDAAEKVIGGLINAPPPKTFERWTGWYTSPTAGLHTLSVHSNVHYRLYVDDRLVIDNSKTLTAALVQVKQDFTPGSHKVVFEQGEPADFGDPNLQVNIVRDGTFVQPMAKKLAAQADVVILAVGFDAESEGEGNDREFSLPPGQNELIREISAINPNTIVVVFAGGAVDVRPWLEGAAGVISAWYPGQEGGAALADLIAGDASPSGRLPISWDRAPEDNPSFDNYYYNDASHVNGIAYREGIFVGYRGYQKLARRPQFPFGYGLSYSTFGYSHMSVSSMASIANRQDAALFTVSFDVTNTGEVEAANVAQVYVASTHSKVARPIRELKGFARTNLKPGETQRVTVSLTPRSFSYYDEHAGAWRADAGRYRVELGNSSADIVDSLVVNLPQALKMSP